MAFPFFSSGLLKKKKRGFVSESCFFSFFFPLSLFMSGVRAGEWGEGIGIKSYKARFFLATTGPGCID